MRRILYILLVTVLASCAKEQVVTKQSLLLTHEKLNFNYKNSSYTVTVKCVRPWTLESDSEWLGSSSKGEEQSAAVKIFADRNDGAQRTGTITVSDGTEKVTLVVTQSADTRNYLDIRLENIPDSYEKLNACTLVIPYRKGGSTILGKLSATVAGEARGSIKVETKENVRLESGAGEIRMKVSGRAGKKGDILFTVAGLPPTVYGESAQCVVGINEGESLEEKTIAQLKALPDGVIAGKLRVSGTVVAGPDVVGGYAVQDKVSGIKVTCTNLPEITVGSGCLVYLKDSQLCTENGIRTLKIADQNDMEAVNEGEDIEASVVSEPADFEKYEMMLCSVDACQCTPEEMIKSSFAGSVRMEKIGWKQGFVLYSSETSPIRDLALKTGYGKVFGIAGKDASGTRALLPRDWYEVSGLTGERVDMSAVFEVDTVRIAYVPSKGQSGVCINLKSSVDWNLTCDETSWISNWSAKSGSGSKSAQPITFDVAANTGPRRSAVIELTGKGVAPIKVKVIQLEGHRILDCPLTEIKTSLASNPKYYPSSNGAEITNSLSNYGLSGWYGTNIYTALNETGEYGVIRVGKTLTKGYIQTPKFAAVGKTPTVIEISCLAGKYKKSTPDWFGIEIIGDGDLVEGEDLIYVEKYDAHYSSDLIETLPCYLINSLNNAAMRRVTFKIENATENTAVKFTATKKGTSDAAYCNIFYIGDIHVNYAE